LAHGVRISALKGQGLDELLVRIEQALADEMVELRVRIPFSRNDLVALFHERGIIEREKFLEDGTLIEGRIAARLVERFEDYQI
jgi:GTP-binding protein HflX